MKQLSFNAPIKAAVLVSGGGTNLQALIDGQRTGRIKNFEIALVVSSKDGAYALERAWNSGIPATVLPRKGATEEGYDRQMDALLSRYDIDLVITSGFLSILGEKVLSRFENAIINIHPSLIPSFCGKGYYGLRVHEKALEYGVKVSGATVHFVSAEVDGGPIILQKAVDVLADDTPESLQQRIMVGCEQQLLPEAVSLFCEGRLEIEGRMVRIKPEEETNG